MPNIPSNESTKNSDYFENKPIAFSAPQVSELEWIPFPQSYFWISAIWHLVFLAFASLAYLLFSLLGSRNIELFVYKDFLFLGLLVFQFLLLLHLWFAIKRRGFALRKHDLVYKSGVFFRSVMILPFIRIQHTEIGENPLLNAQSLCNLSLLTAANSDLRLNGIEKEKAAFLREYIHEYIKNRNGNAK